MFDIIFKRNRIAGPRDRNGKRTKNARTRTFTRSRTTKWWAWCQKSIARAAKLLQKFCAIQQCDLVPTNNNNAIVALSIQASASRKTKFFSKFKYKTFFYHPSYKLSKTFKQQLIKHDKKMCNHIMFLSLIT